MVWKPRTSAERDYELLDKIAVKYSMTEREFVSNQTAMTQHIAVK